MTNGEMIWKGSHEVPCLKKIISEVKISATPESKVGRAQSMLLCTLFPYNLYGPY